jgi:hypothetical protein
MYIEKKCLSVMTTKVQLPHVDGALDSDDALATVSSESSKLHR